MSLHTEGSVSSALVKVAYCTKTTVESVQVPLFDLVHEFLILTFCACNLQRMGSEAWVLETCQTSVFDTVVK